MENKQSLGSAAALAEWSPRDFLQFGVPQWAYIREINGPHNVTAYGVYGADGAVLSVAKSHQEAVIQILHNDMDVVTLQ